MPDAPLYRTTHMCVLCLTCAAATTNPMAALLGGSAIKISVTLSELRERVKSNEAEDDNIPIDLSVLGAGESRPLVFQKKKRR